MPMQGSNGDSAGIPSRPRPDSVSDYLAESPGGCGQTRLAGPRHVDTRARKPGSRKAERMLWFRVAVGGNGCHRRRSVPDATNLHLDARQLEVGVVPVVERVQGLAHLEFSQCDGAKVRNHQKIPVRLHSGDLDVDALNQRTCDGPTAVLIARFAGMREFLDAIEFLIVLVL